jgi:ribonuclease P protein component
MSSEFFSLSLRRQRMLTRVSAGPFVAQKPQIAVAKKLFARAVDRNLVKRVVRETYRDAPPLLGTVLIRLKKRPPMWALASVRARKKFVRQEVQSVLMTSKVLPVRGSRP